MRMDQRKEVNEMSDDMQKDAVLTAVELMRQLGFSYHGHCKHADRVMTRLIGALAMPGTVAA